MHSRRAVLLAGVACAMLAEIAHAHETGPGMVAAVSNDDIIVTARRKGESLQDVPQTVNAVSSDTIQRLRINNASDIAQVVPGLSVEGASSGSSGGFGSSSGLRGVPTFLASNASPVVQFYLNDAPTGRGPEASSSLFDIGQIEVLKGPQGTLRGRSAPTGAITITARPPDLNEIGGFLNLSATSRGNTNIQAAIGVPLIEDVLGLRVAGVVDQNEGNGVTSTNHSVSPLVRNEAVRATLLFQPSSDFEATVLYQRAWRDNRTFRQVAGPGNGANGPEIAPRDRLAINDLPDTNKGHTDFVVGQAQWIIGGQKLSYVGSFRKSKGTTGTAQDIANVLPGIEYFQDTVIGAKEISQELRLGSEERILGIFDYTVGAFFDRETSHTQVSSVAQFLTGAFGRPGAPAIQEPRDRYTLNTAIRIDPIATEKSVFGSITAHLGDSTELAAGGRYIHFKRRDRVELGLLGGFNALNNPTGGFLPCSALGALSPQLAGAVASPVYTGSPSVCDLPVAGRNLQSLDRTETFKPALYNVSLSHKVTPDFMVYGNVGSAFRSAGPAIGITSAVTCCTQVGGPDLGEIEDLIFHGQERSTTYEIGFKSSFLEKRLRLNVALFKQKFDNFFFLTQSTRYLAVTDPRNPAASNISTAEFTADADAKVHGVDVELGLRVTPRWNVDFGFTWSKARLDNALIPCNDGNFDGVVDDIAPDAQDFINAGVMVARCRSNESISRTPRWNLTIQSEYAAPISNRTDAFIRGNFVYYPNNPNASQGVVIDKYSLLNLFIGARDNDNGWEISLFANNLLNTRQLLAVNAVEQVSSGGAAAIFGQPGSGYRQVGYTPRREFGLLVRYAFGAR
jgi:iron complex outermembrane receptor protein